MPFRERVRKAMGRKSSQSSSSTLSKTERRGIGDPNVYQPGEPMPQSKYRAPVDRKHRERLDAFQFSLTAFRRPSRSSVSSTGGLSAYSPMGTKLSSRNNSVSEGPVSGTGEKGPRSRHRRKKSDVGKVEESMDDPGDITNVGKSSKRPSKEHDRFDSRHPKVQATGVDAGVSPGSAPDHVPFTEADIHQALSKGRTHLAPPTATS